MGKINSLIICMFALILISCRNETENSVSTLSIDFSSVELDSIVGLPISAHFWGNDSLMVNDQKGKYMLRMFNIAAGKDILDLCAIGTGPNELFPPIRTTKVNDSIYILNLSSKIVYTCSPDQPDLKEIFKAPDEVMGLYYLPRHKVFIAPAIQLGEASKSSDVYAYVYNEDFSQRQKLTGFAKLWDGEKSMESSYLNKFHQIQGVCEVGNNMIAIMETHLIRLYSTEKNQIELKKEILLYPYEYETSPASQGSLLPTAKLKNGFVKGARDIVAYDDKMLISVDFNVKGEPSEENNVKLILLDKEGELKAIYETGKTLSPYPLAISVDGKIAMFSEDNGLLLLADFPK